MTVEKLHTDFGDYLLRCLRLYGVADDACEDVRQDLYLRLLESQRTIRDTHIKGFCSKITRDAAVDWLRKENRAPAMVDCVIVDEDGFEGMHPEIESNIVRKWESAMGDPNIMRISEALGLAQTYWCDPGVTAYDVLADLLYGLTMEQVGEKHGVSKSTVSRWVRDWQKWIKEKL